MGGLPVAGGSDQSGGPVDGRSVRGAGNSRSLQLVGVQHKQRQRPERIASGAFDGRPQEGLRVATVDAENRVRLKTVTLLRDLGKSIDIGTGLTASDRVIESPPDGINEGDPVQIAAPENKSPAEGKPATDGKRDAGKG